MARQKMAAETPNDEVSQAEDGAAADQSTGDQERAAVKPPKIDPLIAPSWKPDEEVPNAGGSFVRQADGSLIKASVAEQEEA